MPTKRKSTPTGTTAHKATNNKDQNLGLLLKLLNEKIDQGFDALNRKIDTVDQKVDAHRQETAAEFKAIRGETAQGLESVRGEMAQGFDNLRQEFTSQLESSRHELTTQLESSRQEFTTQLESSRQEFTTELETSRQELITRMDGVSEGAYQHYLRIEKTADANREYYQKSLNNLQTAMDASAKDYEHFKENRETVDGEIRELQSEVKDLKKRDMEKAAAIERIEKQLKAA